MSECQHSRLASLPNFLRAPSFWGGVFNASFSNGNGVRRSLREFLAGHSWGIDGGCNQTASESLEGAAAVEVAIALLVRGAWTNCSWRVEQAIAEQFNRAGLGEIEALDPDEGALGFIATPANGVDFNTALISGRLPSELQGVAPGALWDEGERRAGAEGSAAELQFFNEVLVPALGFPLLDYLRFQPRLTELGLDPKGFVDQRADFAIETGRGLKLVIEVDGSQHTFPLQSAQDSVRNAALAKLKWDVWRIPTTELNNAEGLVAELRKKIAAAQKSTWLEMDGHAQRPRELLNVVWGATVASRIQFLILKALQAGLLAESGGWRLRVEEHETQVASLAIEDFLDWFGRLRSSFGVLPLTAPHLVTSPEEECDLRICVSVTNPAAFAPRASGPPSAWSVPYQGMAPEPVFTFKANRKYKCFEEEHLRLFTQDLFRKPDFREGQLDIVRRILAGQDVMGLLPTGGGKSLTYQIAALLLPGATLYVAPLKSLLQDQYERMKAEGIDAAAFISSALDSAQKLRAQRRFEAGHVRVLQVAPERFLMSDFRTLLSGYQAAHGPIAQVVVDECHCVSEWGHDFRPSYLSLGRIVRERAQRLGSLAPIVALTGTASSVVLEDVRRELGMPDRMSEVRASNLDRPELALTFVAVKSDDERKKALGRLATDFQQHYQESKQGMLVFTSHTNGRYGVLELGAEVAASMGLTLHDGVKVYSGQQPRQIGVADWEDYKASAQRDFLCGGAGSFQVMVATKAFGMGIDKPAIRQIVHVLAPQSPEGYYQEVGRAGRDRKASAAHLLFNDANPSMTDDVFSPATDITRARTIYLNAGRNTGDFLLTFFFHQSRFSGVDAEVECATRALAEICEKVTKTNSAEVLLGYRTGGSQAGGTARRNWFDEPVLEQSLVRLIHLGVVGDYTKEYRAHQLVITVTQAWRESRGHLQAYIEYLSSSFESYLKRYSTLVPRGLFRGIREANSAVEAEHAAIEAMVQYLYDEVERKRRTATRTMLEITRVGTQRPQAARTLLLHYLQASQRFTSRLETYAVGDPLDLSWTDVFEGGLTPAEAEELRGAVTRILESYPTHPGLLLLSSVLRLQPSGADRARSVEEFQAALDNALKLGSVDQAADLAEAALEHGMKVNGELSEDLGSLYGRWSYKQFGPRFAMDRVSNIPSGRVGVLIEVLKATKRSFPAHV